MLAVAAVKLNGLPTQTLVVGDVVIDATGFGLIVTEKLIGEPAQPFKLGVAVKLPIVVLAIFGAV